MRGRLWKLAGPAQAVHRAIVLVLLLHACAKSVEQSAKGHEVVVSQANR